VCGAVWADVVGDSGKELVIVGEWMTPRIFSYNGSKFEEVKTNLNNLFGWWQTVSAVDLNGDGRQDLILGNIGENFYLRPDSAHPVKLWINDYDQNGSIEKIMTYTVKGRDMPVFLKRDMEDQLPSIKKNNLKNEAYADKSIQELFPGQLDKAIVKNFTYPASCIAINKGNGQFEIRPLPIMAQLSCINVVYPLDVNNDGHPDLVLGGNQFQFLPQFERLDASLGDVLMNDGKGNFNWQEARRTGLQLRGEVRDIVSIKTMGETRLLFLQNNSVPVLYGTTVSKSITASSKSRK
jgi:hypothetical protein